MPDHPRQCDLYHNVRFLTDYLATCPDELQRALTEYFSRVVGPVGTAAQSAGVADDAHLRRAVFRCVAIPESRDAGSKPVAPSSASSGRPASRTRRSPSGCSISMQTPPISRVPR